MPQGVSSYVQQDYEPLVLYIRNVIPDDMGISLPEHLANRGPAQCGLSRRRELRHDGVLRSLPFR